MANRSEPVSPNPADWRPMRYSGRIRNIKDAVIEPAWSGVRVLARVEMREARFFDEEGIDCTEEFGEIAIALADAALATELILDGYLTIEPTQPSEGVRTNPIEVPGGTQVMATMLLGSKLTPKVPAKRHLDTDQPIAFVAVDLLSVDDTRLLDIPLLERKRILDGALRQGNRIRITPYVRPPVGTFGVTWKGLGFEELVYKAPNSHYIPNGENDEWSIAPIPRN